MRTRQSWPDAGKMTRIILIVLLLAAAYLGIVNSSRLTPQAIPVSDSAASSDDILARLFAERGARDPVQVQGSGIVKKLLPDDSEGSRHQRFIIQLANGQTLLISHNIDLAERIETLKPGDRVEFNGEYEWNQQGGVIHWTHRDPDGRHSSGWIRHKGLTYW